MNVQEMLRDALRWAISEGIPVGVPTDGFGVTLACSEFGAKWLRTDGPVDAAAALLLHRNPPLRATNLRSMPWLQFYDALCEVTGMSPGEVADLLWNEAAEVATGLAHATGNLGGTPICPN